MQVDKNILVEVLEIKQETPSFFDLKLTPLLEQNFPFQSGQYVFLTHSSGQKECFAIASEPEEKNFIQFLIKDKEGINHELCHLKKGDPLKISMPAGTAYPFDKIKGKDLILVGIGSALAPLRSLVKSIMRRDQLFGKIILVYGARKKEEIPYWNDFKLWNNKFEIHFALSQEASQLEKMIKGRVNDVLTGLEFGNHFAACICGNKTMEAEVTKLLETKGISKQNIFLNY